MNSSYRMVPLKEVLTKSEESTDINPEGRYKQVTVQLWGKGANQRNEVSGIEISSERRIVVRAKQFILSRIDARNGAFGIIPEFLDGAVVSNDFPVFNLNASLIFPDFLGWMSKTRDFVEICKSASEGTTNRVRLKVDRFLDAEILLPEPEEQRRIVARIEELAARIEEARKLRRRISDSDLQNLRIAAFCRAFQGKLLTQNNNDEPASAAIEKMAALKSQLVKEHKIKAEKPLPTISEIEKEYQLPKSWEWVRLGDMCELITDGTHQTPKYTDEGMIFLSAQNIKPYEFMPQNHRYVSYEDYLSYIQHAKPKNGDILMTRVGAMIGEAAIIDQDLDFAFYVSLCLIRPLRNLVHVPYVLHWLNSPYGAASSRKNTLGKGHSQGNLNLNLIKRFVLPLPSLNEQHHIVTYLDDLQSKLDALRCLQKETAAELDALMPSILDRAFRGEL